MNTQAIHQLIIITLTGGTPWANFTGGSPYVRSYRLTNNDQIRHAGSGVFVRAQPCPALRGVTSALHFLSGGGDLYLLPQRLTRKDQIQRR